MIALLLLLILNDMSFLLLNVGQNQAKTAFVPDDCVFACSFNNNFNELFGRTSSTSGTVNSDTTTKPNSNWAGVARLVNTNSRLTYPVDSGSNTLLQNYSGDWTIEFLTIKPTANALFIGEQTGSFIAPVRIDINTADVRTQWGNSSLSTNSFTNRTIATMSATQWYHFALTKTGSTCKIYQDGTEITSFTSAPSTMGDGGITDLLFRTSSAATQRIANFAIYKRLVYTTTFNPNYDPWEI